MTMIDPTTGRQAWTGPMGEPGSATPFPGAAQWTMPNGQVAYYQMGAPPSSGNISALQAAGYTPAAAVGTYEGYPENPGGGPAAQFPGSAPLGSGPQGPGTGQSGGTAASTPQQDQTAQAIQWGIIQQALQQMGITDPGALSWAQGLISSGASAQSIEVQMYSQPWFQQRFPGIFERQKAGLPPISPADYLGYEDQARQLEGAYGLPPGFLDDRNYVGNLIGSDVSMAELQNRVEQGFSVVQQAPQEVRDAFSQFYGPNGDSALASYVLDRSRSVPLLEKQVAAAEFGGTGAQQGFGIGRGTAELAAGLGITPGEARSGFGQLNQIRPFFTPGVGETGVPDINTTGVSAQFGLDATAQQLVAAQESQRRAEFAGGGGGVTTNQGVVGAGQQKAF